jgi:hypothetical protein
MGRFQDYLTAIKGEETQQQSGLDTVKNMLKGVGVTALAGLVGGDLGVSLAGQTAGSYNAANKQRKLDKIANAKAMLGAERDIAAIEASEANVANDKARLGLSEKEMADRARERTEQSQQHLRELKFRMENGSLDRELKKNELKQRKDEIVAETRRKLLETQDKKTKQGIGQITKAASQFPMDPESDKYEKEASTSAAAVAQMFREQLGTQNALQAEKNWNDLDAQGQLNFSPRIKPLLREKVIAYFRADEMANLAKRRSDANLPPPGQPMPEPTAGFINDGINAVNSVVPAADPDIYKRLAGRFETRMR